jgi:hypothetical protein
LALKIFILGGKQERLRSKVDYMAKATYAVEGRVVLDRKILCQLWKSQRIQYE